MRAFFRDAVSEVTNRVTANRIVAKATASDKLDLDEEEALEVVQDLTEDPWWKDKAPYRIEMLP